METNLVPRTPNLDKRLGRNCHLHRLRLMCCHLCGVQTRIPRILCCPSRQIRLMFLSLRMGQVRPFIRMQRKTQTTFQSTQMIPQDVGILNQNRRSVLSFATKKGRRPRWGRRGGNLRSSNLSSPTPVYATALVGPTTELLHSRHHLHQTWILHDLNPF